MYILAVVGMGSIAKRHIRNLRGLHPTAKIYSVSASGRNLELPEHADEILVLDDLISHKPDYVIIASPAPYHVEVAKKLIVNNINVLIEKPLAQNSEDCIALQETLKDHSGTSVAVGYCLRFLPSSQVVKDFLDCGSLGTVYNIRSTVGQYLPDWRTDKDFKESVSASKSLGGGALLELSHELDYLYWLMGSLSLQYSSLRTTKELGLEVEDIADLVLVTEDNVLISLHLDFIQKSAQRTCEIIGQNGRLEWDLISNSVLFYSANGTDVLYSDPEYDKNGMYLDMLREFEVLLQRPNNKLATVDSSTKLVQIIEEAKYSEN